MGEILESIRSIYSYAAVKGADYSYRDETDLFSEERMAIYVNGIWAASMIPEELDVQYALFPAEEGTSMSVNPHAWAIFLGIIGKRTEGKRASVF